MDFIELANDAFQIHSLLIILGAMTLIYFIAKYVFKKYEQSVITHDNNEIVLGILFVSLGHVAIYFLIQATYFSVSYFSDSFKIFLGFVFIFQIVYVIPGLIAASHSKRKGILKGIIIAASVTFLLSMITCFGPCSNLF